MRNLIKNCFKLAKKYLLTNLDQIYTNPRGPILGAKTDAGAGSPPGTRKITYKYILYSIYNVYNKQGAKEASI